MGRRPLSLAVTTAAVSLAILLGLPLGVARADETHVYVVGITDFHGHIENGARLAGSIDQERSSFDGGGVTRTVMVSAGDNINASYFASSIANDDPAMDQLNAMGLSVSTLGNHEFDKGVDDLSRVLAKLGGTTFVSSNLTGSDLTDKGVAPYYVTTINGKRIGFVGAMTMSFASSVNPALVGNVTVSDIEASINFYAHQLRDGDEANGEADAVIALVHEGAAALTNLDPTVDAVFAGHTHVKSESATPSDAPVLQAECYGRAYGVVDLKWADDNSLSRTGRVVSVEKDAPIDSQVQAIADEAEAQAKIIGAQQVGSIAPNVLGVASTFNRGVADPLSGTSVSGGNQENRGTESTLGNLVADSVMLYANAKLGEGSADIGVINAGGLRLELDPNNDGVITYQEAHDVLPFGNSNAIVTLTGAQLRSALEQQWQPAGSRRPVLWLGLSSNVTYSYEPSLANDGVTPVARVFDLRVNGNPVQDGDSFKVCGNTFLLQGGDNFSVFTEGTDYVDTGLIDLDCFVDYLKQNSQSGISSKLRRQSAGFSNLKIENNTVSFDVSGLSFTTNEPNPSYAHVVVNGIDFGYVTVSETGAVADQEALKTSPAAGQAHVEKTLTSEELDTFGTELRTTGYLATDVPVIDDASATYVNFGTMPSDDPHGDPHDDEPVVPGENGKAPETSVTATTTRAVSRRGSGSLPQTGDPTASVQAMAALASGGSLALLGALLAKARKRRS